MKVAIIGTGHIGLALGPLLAEAGHRIVYGTEQEDRSVPSGTDAASVAESLANAGAVVVAIPFGAWPEFSRRHATALTGKVVIDATNTNAERDGAIVDEVRKAGSGTLSFVAALLPGAQLVKAFNTMTSEVLAEGANQPGGRLAYPIASDDVAAVGVAARLVMQAGFDPVVVGGAAAALTFDQGTPVWNRPQGAAMLAAALGVTASPARAAHAFFAAYAHGDADAMTALCAPEATIDYVPMGADGRGTVLEVGAPLWRGFIAAFESFTPDVEDLWIDSARATAIVRTTNRGRQRADFAGIPSSSGELAVPHLFLLSLRDGLITRVTAWWDGFTVDDQLGRPRGARA